MVGVLQAKSASHAWVVAAPSLLFVLWSFVHIRRAYRWEKLPFQEVAFQCEETVETVVVKTLVRGVRCIHRNPELALTCDKYTE